MSERTPEEALAEARYTRRRPLLGKPWDKLSGYAKADRIEIARADINVLNSLGFDIVPLSLKTGEKG